MAKPQSRSPRARIDLLLVLASTLLAYFVAVAVELHERWLLWQQRYEYLQVDELLPTALVLAAGMVCYAFRRRREALAALDAQARAQAHAAALLAHNRRLAQALIEAQEGEREAIARELHDELAQGCTALRFEIACLRQPRIDDAQRLAAAERADAAAQSLYRRVRELLRRLRPAELDALGLVGALQALAEAGSRHGLRCRFECRSAVADAAEWLAPATQIAVYRVAQEALTNVQRHARARHARIELARGADGALRLEISDDGRGMDPKAPTRGLGLLGAGERAAALGGTLQLAPSPSAGVRLTLCVPWRLRAPQAVAPADAGATLPLTGPAAAACDAGAIAVAAAVDDGADLDDHRGLLGHADEHASGAGAGRGARIIRLRPAARLSRQG